MLAHNGSQLAGRCIPAAQSLAARSFYGAFWRWSTVDCAARGRAAALPRRGYASSSAEGDKQEGSGIISEERVKDGHQGSDVQQAPDIFESSGAWGQKGWQLPISGKQSKAELHDEVGGEGRNQEAEETRKVEGTDREVTQQRDTKLGGDAKKQPGNPTSAKLLKGASGARGSKISRLENPISPQKNTKLVEDSTAEPSKRPLIFRRVQSDGTLISGARFIPLGNKLQYTLPAASKTGEVGENESHDNQGSVPSLVRTKRDSIMSNFTGISRLPKRHLIRLMTGIAQALSKLPDKNEVPNPIDVHGPVTDISNPTETLSAKMRSLMRMVTHPVTVITTTAKPIPQIPDDLQFSDIISEFRGMTISSFTTVSLDPEPIVSFNIRTPSSTLDALKATRYFLVSLLPQNRRGLEIANAFTKDNGAGGKPEDIFQTPAGCCRLIGPPVNDLSMGGYLPQPLRDGAIHPALRCEVLGVTDRAAYGGGDGIIQVGDHAIVLARVHAIQPPLRGTTELEKMKILCYQHGDYVGTRSLAAKSFWIEKRAEHRRRTVEEARQPEPKNAA